MLTKHDRLSYQQKLGAVFLPLSQSLCFYKTNYGTLNKHYVVWLARDTARELCKKDLSSIDSHYLFDHSSSLWRVHAPPSSRLALPYVAYWNGELKFTNGRHRTRTLLDFGAKFIPFDIEEASLQEMAQDGIKFDGFLKAKDFEEKQSSMRPWRSMAFDPIIETYKRYYPKQMPLAAVLKASCTHFRMSCFDITSREQLTNVFTELKRDRDLGDLKDNSHIHKEIDWYNKALRAALPVFAAMKKQGVNLWPNGSGFPSYVNADNREKCPEKLVKEWKDHLAL